MPTTAAPSCFRCGKRAGSWYLSRSTGYLVDADKMCPIAPDTANARNTQDHWVCSECCHEAVLYPVCFVEEKGLVAFMVARHALTQFRHEEGETKQAVWSGAAADCGAAGINMNAMITLKHAYQEGTKKIYSILPERDPCPQIFVRWVTRMANKHDLLNLYYGIQVFTMCTNRVVAEMLVNSDLDLENPLSETRFGKMFTPEVLVSATQRGNLEAAEKIAAMFRLRGLLRTAAARADVLAVMCKVLAGDVEAVGALVSDPRKLTSNGEFRFFFTARLLKRHYAMMNVKVVIGSHLWEVKKKKKKGEVDGEVHGAYSRMLLNVKSTSCKLSLAERVEFLHVLRRLVRVRLCKMRRSKAAGELSLVLTVADLESTLCEWMKYLRVRSQMAEPHPKKRKLDCAFESA